MNPQKQSLLPPQGNAVANLATFAKKISSFMTRSLWKGPFVNPTILTAKTNAVWYRHSSILPQFVHKKFKIHNGKSFIEIEIQESMIGHKFGEFALTRKRPTHKKKEKKR